jgi:hypothetical protein
MHLIAARTARLMRPHECLQALCSFADSVCRQSSENCTLDAFRSQEYLSLHNHLQMLCSATNASDGSEDHTFNAFRPLERVWAQHMHADAVCQADHAPDGSEDCTFDASRPLEHIFACTTCIPVCR